MTWQPDSETTNLIRAYCLQNALQYEGKGKAGSVIGRLMGERADLRAYGKEISPMVASLVDEANLKAGESGLESIREELRSLAPHLLEKQVKERRQGLPELPETDAEEVILRFAPNPNGPLSFGHSRGVVINSEYVKSLGGKLILRFDDTDTVRKPPLPESYSMIEQEVRWLTEIEPVVVIASDRIEIYHQHALELLRMNGAYVCLCSADEFKQHRLDMSECPHRDADIEINLGLWKQMNDGRLKAGDAVVRVRTEMSLPNPALRDWPALRIQDTDANPHPRIEIGNRWKVWPLLDFQSAVEDHLQGVTHIIRGKDLMDSTRKQVLLYEHFGWKYPETIYWGRVKVHEYGGFSTSGMRTAIEDGEFMGWDDVRLPTLAAMRRRGIRPEALRSFWIELGLTQKDISVALSTLNSHNTKVIDRESPRLAFVRDAVALELDATNVEVGLFIEVAGHPEHGDFPVRRIDISSGIVHIEKSDFEIAVTGNGRIRLKDFADIQLGKDGKAEIVKIEPQPGTNIVHWVSAGTESRLYSGEGNTLNIETGILEKNTHPTGMMVQLERIGYAMIEDDDLVLCHY